MSFRTLLFTLAGVTATSAAFAEIDVADLAQSYVAQGYSRVEITSASGEVRVEAIKGATGVEVVYDRASGDVLSLEAGRASARDRSETGVSFVSFDSAGRRGGGADDAGDRRGRGRDDNGADDNGGRGRGGDDNGADDNGGRGRGNDDNGADDNGGRGRGGDDNGRGDDRGRGRGADDRGGDDRGGRGRGRDD